MTLETLNTAIAEARRFIKKAEEAKKKNYTGKGEYVLWCSKESATAKRASMDLTRALAELRKVNR
jgi:hypothetical protein